jgi:hypothetical protein
MQQRLAVVEAEAVVVDEVTDVYHSVYVPQFKLILTELQVAV